jgi:hypothetical protein
MCVSAHFGGAKNVLTSTYEMCWMVHARSALNKVSYAHLVYSLKPLRHCGQAMTEHFFIHIALKIPTAAREFPDKQNF